MSRRGARELVRWRMLSRQNMNVYSGNGKKTTELEDAILKKDEVVNIEKDTSIHWAASSIYIKSY